MVLRHCKSFNGLLSGTCKSGVDYEVVAVRHAQAGGRRRSFPCLPSENVGGACCPKFVEETPEPEVEQVAFGPGAP